LKEQPESNTAGEWGKMEKTGQVRLGDDREET